MALDTVTVGPNRIAFRRGGTGPAVLLVHGWPFHGECWEPVVGELAPTFDCIRPDSPGLGRTAWSAGTDFSMPAQAETLLGFLDVLGVARCAVLAHDTGATIARLMANRAPDRIRALVLLNTEMPGHRPPWIPLYRQIAGLPGAGFGFAQLLRWGVFQRSPMGFGGCFFDPARIDDAFVARYVTPVVRSPERLDGTLRYLRGVDWALVDRLGEINGRIAAPVKLVWGADDPTFPLAPARAMATQFPRSAGIEAIPQARFLVHEERPAEVARAARDVLTAP